MTTKREAWRQYACAALEGACARPQDFETQDDGMRRVSACDNADDMLSSEEERFGPFESTEHTADDVRTLEERVRVLAAERDEACAANEALHQDRAQLRAQLASAVPAVPVSELRELIAEAEAEESHVHTLVGWMRDACNEAEQRARAGEGVGHD